MLTERGHWSVVGEPLLSGKGVHKALKDGSGVIFKEEAIVSPHLGRELTAQHWRAFGIKRAQIRYGRRGEKVWYGNI